jgi:L-aminopeptidase/D-esterase-like protein
MSRALHPSHTRFDGDLTIAVATGAVDVHFDRVRAAATDVVAAAIRDAVS